VIGYKNKEKHKERLDYECMKALDIRNRTRMNMLWKETRTAIEEYKEAHEKHIKSAEIRQKNMKKKLQSVQTYNISNESRKFHQEVRRFKERYQPRSTI
jgi:Mg2+ and Co2+ transporter CorA